MPRPSNNLRAEPTPVALDRIDRAILLELSKNARLSNKELAGRIRLAESSCLERVRRLLARGVIRGFHADVDRRALGNGLEAIVSVRLRQHSLALVRRFHQHLHRLPEVVATYHLGGVNDYLVHVAVRDTVHLKELALEAFAARPEVTHMETALIFEHQVAALQLAATEEPETERKPPVRDRRAPAIKSSRKASRKETA